MGQWEVTNPDGSPTGSNVIAKAQDNCVLVENWTSAKGNFTGTSYNFYNAKSLQWEQIWIDNQGGSLHLKGGIQNGKMVLQSETKPNDKGQVVVNRVTWTANPDGTVRQLWESLVDGKVTVVFDGLYKKTE